MGENKSKAFNEGRAAFVAQKQRCSNLYFNCSSYYEWHNGWDYEYNKYIDSESKRLKPLLFNSVPEWVATIKLRSIGHIADNGYASKSKSVWLMYDHNGHGDVICPNQPETNVVDLEIHK